MRFSETPVSDDLTAPVIETGSPAVSPPADDRGAVAEVAAQPERKANANPNPERSSPERERARELIEHIGSEFTRLRKVGRSGAWADLEDKLMRSAHVLIEAGMMSAKEWISISIDIEQFRQAEGGSLDSAGDILAKWLTEDDVKPKGKKKIKEVTQ